MIVDSIPQVRRVLDFYKKSAADSTPTDSSADSTVDSATDSDGAESTLSPLNLKVRRESIGILVCWLSKKSDMTSVGLLAGDLNCPPQTPSDLELSASRDKSLPKVITSCYRIQTSTGYFLTASQTAQFQSQQLRKLCKTPGECSF